MEEELVEEKRRRELMRLDTQFAHVRSLMQRESLDERERQILWHRIQVAMRSHPERYRDEWIPYLQCFTRHFQEPIAWFHNIKALEAAVDVAPFASFGFSYGSKMSPDELAASVAQTKVCSLKISIDSMHLLSRSEAHLSSLERLTLFASLDTSRKKFEQIFELDLISQLKDLGLQDVSEDTLMEVIRGCERLSGLKRLRFERGKASAHIPEALVNSPHLRTLEALSLRRCEVGDAECSAIVERFNTLRELDLYGNRVGEAGARAIATSMSALQQLELGSNALGFQGVANLTGASNLSSLRALYLYHNGIGDEGLGALARSNVLTSLEALQVIDNGITHEGVMMLAQSKNLATMRSLNLYSNKGIKAPGVEALVASPHLGRIEVLNLCDCGVGAKGAKALGSANLPALRELDLSGNRTGKSGAKALAKASWMEQLRTLNLDDNRMEDQGVMAILSRLKRIEALSLGGNLLQDDAVCELARNSAFADLVDVGLFHNEVGDEGACALARSEVLMNLNVLNLASNEIGDEGARALATSPILSNLDLFYLSQNPVSRAGKEALSSSPLFQRIAQRQL